MRRCLLLTALLTLGCSGLFQSYAGGLQVICDAPNTCTECAGAEASMRMTMLAKHIDANLYNSDARTAFEALATASTQGKIDILRHEATDNGIQQCALADLWETEHRQMLSDGVQRLCALSTDCGSFDPANPGTVITCVDKADLHWELRNAVELMSQDDSRELAAEVQKLAAQHGQPACALASALRNAP